MSFGTENSIASMMNDLQVELEKTQTIDGIPFDTAYMWIKIRKN